MRSRYWPGVVRRFVASSGTLNQKRGLHGSTNTPVERKPASPPTTPPTHSDKQAPSLLRDDFRRAGRTPQAWRAPTVRHTNNLGQAERWLEELLEYDRLAIDIESTGLSAKDKLVSIGFAYSYRRYVLGVQICVESTTEPTTFPFVEARATTPLLRPIRRTTYRHNGQFDTKILRCAHRSEGHEAHAPKLLVR